MKFILNFLIFSWLLFAQVDGKNPHFLVVLVDAPHLDYKDSSSLLQSIAKHAPQRLQSGNFGHAWIYLHGIREGREVYLEGGHSGELGILQPKYFDGIMNLLEFGYASPTLRQQQHPIHEPNPIKYLWAIQKDGFFQKGNGRHKPTFAAKIQLTEQQFNQLLKFIQEDYDFRNYSLTGNQCCTFAVQVAALAGLFLEHEKTIDIHPEASLNGERFQLWKDVKFARIKISSPDILESGLRRAVKEGRAEKALEWYYLK